MLSVEKTKSKEKKRIYAGKKLKQTIYYKRVEKRNDETFPKGKRKFSKENRQKDRSEVTVLLDLFEDFVNAVRLVYH